MSLLWGLSMAGTATCLLQNASGIPMLRRICQEGDASRYTRLPLFTMTVVTVQIGLYGYFVYGLPEGLQLLLANAIGLSLWIPSFIVFLVHTPGARAKASLSLQYLAALAWGVGLPVGLFSSPALSLSAKQNTLAAFMQVANFSGFLSPVASLRAALVERSARRVPGMLSYVNALNSTLWTAYGAVLGDGWILWPNVVGLLIALAQVVVLLAVRRMEAHDAGAAAERAPAKPAPPACAEGVVLRSSAASPADAAYCAALPKAELHRHVHGSLRAGTLLELLRANAPPGAAEDAEATLRALGAAAPPGALGAAAPSEEGAPRLHKGSPLGRRRLPLHKCFTLFDHIHAAVRSEADLARVVREALEDADADNVRYVELRSTPRALVAEEGSPPAFPLPPGVAAASAGGGSHEAALHRYVAVLVAELARAAVALPRLTARLLISVNRAEPLGAAEAILRVAVAWAPVALPLPPLFAARGGGSRAVIGLDVGGDPLAGDISAMLAPLSAARAAAAAAGAPLRATVHVGEVGGAYGESEVEKVLKWGPERVGHLAIAPAHRLHPATGASLPVVELCPSSNEVTLGLAAKGGLAAHPTMGAWLARARVAISTDDPGVFMCTLSGEYAKAAAAFGLGRERVAALARAAFDYAFLPAEEKAALVEGLGPFGV